MAEDCHKRKLVCFFDSGIGGLPLFVMCSKNRRDCDFVYFADNYNVPYGNLPHEKIVELTFRIFDRMNRLSPTAAVIACNTVTAECAPILRQKYPFPIIGIQPAVKPAAANDGRVAVLATEATANSASLATLVDRFGNGRTSVFACRNLAAYIEENTTNIDKTTVMKMLPDVCADKIVLGCTHYHYVADMIYEKYKCEIYDGIFGTARRLYKILGIFDHKSVERQKISFLGGNQAKNRQIYLFLNQKIDFK